MGRINPLALRIKGMINWPSDVQHPLLENYVKHIFQKTLVQRPAIRASTQGIVINVVLLKLETHPKLFDKQIKFDNIDYKKVMGRLN
jgi:hypothetical protein